MAQAPNTNLPIFYKELVPLNSNDHGDWSTKPLPDARFAKGHHAVPLTTDEFVQASRHYPIIFSANEKPVPLALMGMNEGVNVFVNDDGLFTGPVYVPAYVRRYPFMLAKIRPDHDEMSLCFDPTSGGLGDFEDGEKLFDADKKPTENTNNILQFCEQFEQAAGRTQSFVDELIKAELLMDGEVAINIPDQKDPYVYRGFKMVNEEKMRDLKGNELRKMNQNGMLPLIHAHMFSLQLMRDIFGAQQQQGKAPNSSEQQAAPTQKEPAATAND